MAHDLSKLPQWVQHHISDLERRFEDIEGLLTEVGDKDSSITWQEHNSPYVGIPRYATMRYDLKEEPSLRVYFREDHIDVYTMGRLNIQPIGANAVSIGVAKQNRDPSD